METHTNTPDLYIQSIFVNENSKDLKSHVYCLKVKYT